MTKLKIPQGISDFRKLREGGFYYVDKSNFVYEILEASSEVTLIPRPRRFGKTLNVTTLQTWFERLPTGETHTHLLDGLKADRTPGEHHDKRGKLPVVFLTFKDIKEVDWPTTVTKIAFTIQEEIRRLSPWWQTQTLDAVLAKQIQSLREGSADTSLLSNALKVLTELLAQVSGEPPLVLIDEYDTPIQAGVQRGFFREAVDFFRNFLSAGLKDNRHIWKGVLTGILRVSKENLFSGLNNPTVCSLTGPRFQTCFGLSEAEVTKLLKDADLADHLDEVRRWYNGYMFGNTLVYNPWSVLSFIGEPSQGCHAHWVNTASTSLLGQAIADGDGILQKELEQLIRGEDVEKNIDDHVTYDSDGIRPHDIWSFLLFTGYLTTRKLLPSDPVTGLPRAVLAIPNHEVRLSYQKLIAEWTSDKLSRNEDVLLMLEAMVTGHEELFERHFSRLVRNVLSFHDVYPENAESFYHAFVTGMLVYLGPTHNVRSNRESGYGRYDVTLEPHNKSRYPGVVIEFKLVSSKSTVEETLETAHQQILDKKYAAELESAGCNRILRWAIVFRGKEMAMSMRE